MNAIDLQFEDLLQFEFFIVIETLLIVFVSYFECIK